MAEGRGKDSDFGRGRGRTIRIFADGEGRTPILAVGEEGTLDGETLRVFKPILKFLHRIFVLITEEQRWATGEAEYWSAYAMHPFQAQSNQEISFGAGDELRLAPQGT